MYRVIMLALAGLMLFGVANDAAADDKTDRAILRALESIQRELRAMRSDLNDLNRNKIPAPRIRVPRSSEKKAQPKALFSARSKATPDQVEKMKKEYAKRAAAARKQYEKAQKEYKKRAEKMSKEYRKRGGDSEEMRKKAMQAYKRWSEQAKKTPQNSEQMKKWLEEANRYYRSYGSKKQGSKKQGEHKGRDYTYRTYSNKKSSGAHEEEALKKLHDIAKYLQEFGRKTKLPGLEAAVKQLYRAMGELKERMGEKKKHSYSKNLPTKRKYDIIRKVETKKGKKGEEQVIILEMKGEDGKTYRRVIKPKQGKDGMYFEVPGKGGSGKYFFKAVPNKKSSGKKKGHSQSMEWRGAEAQKKAMALRAMSKEKAEYMKKAEMKKRAEYLKKAEHAKKLRYEQMKRAGAEKRAHALRKKKQGGDAEQRELYNRLKKMLDELERKLGKEKRGSGEKYY